MTRTRVARVAATAAVLAGALVACSHPAPHPAATTPAPVVSQEPVAGPENGQEEPAPDVTAAPTAVLRDALTVPADATLDGTVQTITSGAITSWYATLSAGDARAAQQTITDLAAQLTALGLTVHTDDPQALTADGATPAGLVRYDIRVVPGPGTGAYVQILSTLEPSDQEAS